MPCKAMNTRSDAVIVGAGPAGSSAAWELAKHGLSVAVFEEHKEVGVPSHCAGHLSIRSLRNLGLYPLPSGIVENVFSGANFYSPSGTKFSVRLNKPVTCAVNRELFDKHLAAKAQAAGAEYFLGSRVQSLMIEDGFVKGVHVVQGGNVEERVSGKIVVDAEGISSRLLRQAVLSGLNRAGLVYAVEAEVENVTAVEEDAVEVYLGSLYAPGFYGWLIPRLDGTAKVGLAVKAGNPKEFLERLMRRHPEASKQLGAAKVKSMGFHAISLGGPVSKAYSDGFLAVGDVASQVKSTTGGGVVFGLTCSRLAAEVAVEAVGKNDFSASFLQKYQQHCDDALGFDVRVMLRARKFLDSLSDEKLDRLFRFVSKVGLDRALRDVEEIDFQGRTLFTVLREPGAYAALAYLAALYLSARY
jgi:digeranylgeranylglycerophospholipid reductase